MDGTLGMGGHSLEIARRLGPAGRLIAIDRDRRAIERAGERLADYMDRVTLVHGNFRDLGSILDDQGVKGADGMLFDLGVSSPQLDEASRGFSYMSGAPLEFAMDETEPVTARTNCQHRPEERLKRILYDFGEERYAPRIAGAIVRARKRARSRPPFSWWLSSAPLCPPRRCEKSSTRPSGASMPSGSP